MKAFIIISSLLLTLSTFADELTLYQTGNLNAQMTAKFQINSKLGRAWSLVSISDYPTQAPRRPDRLIKLIPGLSYNVSNKSITYINPNAELFTCAHVTFKGRRHNRYTIKMTGQCRFNVKTKFITIDDGTQIYRRKVKYIALETP